MEKKELLERLEDIHGCFEGSRTSQTSPLFQLKRLIKELKQEQSSPLDVRCTCNNPNHWIKTDENGLSYDYCNKCKLEL